MKKDVTDRSTRSDLFNVISLPAIDQSLLTHEPSTDKPEVLTEGANYKRAAYLSDSTFVHVSNTCLDGYVIGRFSGLSTVSRCAAMCSLDQNCKSFNFFKETHDCQINNEKIVDTVRLSVSLPGKCGNYAKI